MLLVLLIIPFAVAVTPSIETTKQAGPFISTSSSTIVTSESLTSKTASLSTKTSTSRPTSAVTNLLKSVVSTTSIPSLSVSTLVTSTTRSVISSTSAIVGLKTKSTGAKVQSTDPKLKSLKSLSGRDRIPPVEKLLLGQPLDFENDDSKPNLDSNMKDFVDNMQKGSQPDWLDTTTRMDYEKIAPKNRKFIHEIRDILQRNNEDYIERENAEFSDGRRKFLEKKHYASQGRRDGALSTPARPTLKHFKKHRSHHHHRNKSNKYKTTAAVVYIPVTVINKKVVESDEVEEKHDHTKIVDKKLKRFMSFVNKNRDLLKHFIETKKKKPRKGLRGGHTKKSFYFRGRNFPVIRGTEKFPLKSDQLDMAPARGARIERLRVQGRVCQRHVMKPEGPKYDSKGNSYMPPFVEKKGRLYEVTKPRKFVLPICCNCCAKSVLGCE